MGGDGDGDSGSERSPVDWFAIANRLARFYPALTQMHVLTEMPTCLVNAAVRDIARLEAEESIREANRIAIGGGTLKAEHARPLVDAWTRHAQGGAAAKPDPSALAVVGFKVRRVKVPKKA